MNTQHLTSLADASNLLLGLDRKLTRVQQEPAALPAQNPIPGILHGFGETTRAKRNIVFSDGGSDFSNQRFASEYQFIPVPVCDPRDTTAVLGMPSRLEGRAPIVRRAS